MHLPEFSVRRPVTTIMIFSAIILLGIMSWNRLPQELFPPITYPQLTVVTTYENAAPEEIETQITRLIEESIGTVSNLRRITSISKEGVSIVIAEFLWSTNMDFAALGVREKIDLIKERLPIDAEEPIVKKFNPFDLPIMTLSITGDVHPARLRTITERYIEDEVEKIAGVASADIAGGIEREILVEVDQDKLQASGVPILDVVDAIRDANLNYPAGTIKEVFTEYLIRTMGEFREVSEIGEIPVSREKIEPESRFPQYSRIDREAFLMQKEEPGETLILLKDVAAVKDTFKEVTSISRYNGKDNISVSVQKQAVANTIDVSEKIRAALKEIEKNIPKDINIEVVYDQSSFIKNSINGVRDAALQGGILAFLVLLVFLRNFRSSFIVTLSIPISIMVTFSFMYFSGLSLNMMSLGGLALGVGMLVDNAVVVIENIFRHRQLGKEAKNAASKATGEVGGPIFASTLTTVAIFLPIIFVIGIAGQLFKELAFTVTFSLLGSLLMALSLIPVLSTAVKIKKQRAVTDDMPDDAVKYDSFFYKIFTGLLRWTLAHKILTLFAAFFLFLISILAFTTIDKELMPKIDQGQFMINVTMPTGTLLMVTDRVTAKIEKTLLDIESVDNVSIRVGSTKGKTGEEALQALGSHQGRIIVNLRKDREKSTQEVIQELKGSLKRVDLERGGIEYLLQESMFQSSLMGAAPIAIEVKGENLNILRKYALRVKALIGRVSGIYGVKTSLTPPSPETKAYVIKDKAATYGLSVSDIAQTSHIAIKGYVVTKFKEKGREIDIKVRLREDDRSNISKLRHLLVHSPLDLDIPLSEVSYFGIGKGPSQIERIEQERTVVVTANIFKRGLDKVIEDIEKVLSRLKLPEEYVVKLGGESEQMQESFKSLMFALIIAVVLVYMIMASIFESLWQPFIIMFAVPLSLIGVAAALLITNTTISIVVILGVIMLGGIVVNNGIVLIDYVNLLRSKNVALYDAIIKASQTRLRPIMMTALTTVLGLIPMALSTGEGSELRAPLAITVMGGLLVATFLTLVIIPILYFSTQSLFDRLRGVKE
ncbi:MAG: efflux RND transporter permease subunit [Candidatus Omnitrophica bacterium]|nr:efflux RND transporter permease subunit [Candidatus Omnitrophota bacterium]